MAGAAGRELRVLCVVDNLGSGGAQRQMVNLALGLKRLGHSVDVVVYHPQMDFFRARLVEAEIPLHSLKKGRGFSWRVVLALWNLLRGGRYDAAVAFLNAPSVYLELASTFIRGVRIIVSERSNHLDDPSPWRARLRRNLHRLADVVVANSAAHADWLARKHPWLRPRVIHNGVDIEQFAAAFTPPATPRDARLIAVGRVGPEKNVLNVIRAMALFHARHGWVPHLTWVGRDAEATGGAEPHRAEVDRLLAAEPAVRERLTFLGERRDVPQLLAAHHALILASFFEGLPNVVCEALAAGRPVVASDISDLRLLVEPGRRGFLFDPGDPQAIVAALESLLALSPDQWNAFSADCAAYARENLSNAIMAARFEELLKAGAAAPRER